MSARVSKVVKIGGFDTVQAVMCGGGFPVVVQTMWKDRLTPADIEGEAGKAIVERIQRLGVMGCGLLRFAVPDLLSADVVGRLANMVSLPLSADIHFDYQIALRCLDYPIAKIRINPGTIGSRERVDAVLSKAADRGIPIRIGVNGGSLPRDLRQRIEDGTLGRAEALVAAAERELAVCDAGGFQQVVVSLKASSVADTMKANRMLAERSVVPLHIGVTEAGPLIAGVVRNTAALYTLLAAGIGDTVRVSLSDSVEREVIAGREILQALSEDPDAPGMGGRGHCGGVHIISCPRCGRNGFDTHCFTERWQNYLYTLRKNCTIAIMGCAVNGPEEARHADLGITGAGNKVLLFRQGRVVRTIDAAEADAAFQEELEKL